MKTGGFLGKMTAVRFDRFLLDTARRQLTRDGELLHLTPKAFDLLVLLVAESPRVIPKGELHARLWKDAFVSDATLTSVVKELRRVLQDRSPERPIIRTAHRVGYAFSRSLDLSTPAVPEAAHWVLVDRRRIMLHAGENVIGRDPEAIIWLDSVAVSRRHARIVIDERSVRLEDLASKNGTKIGEWAVVGAAPLADGDVIHIGPIRLLYRTANDGTTETRSRPADRKS